MNQKTDMQLSLGVVAAKPARGVRVQGNGERHVGTVVLVEGQKAVQIKLTKGKTALVDYEDAERVLAYNWYAYCYKRRLYAHRSHRSAGAHSLHTFILPLTYPMQVDHRNHDGLDCRKINLRSATNSQNTFNMRKRSGCSSRFLGVVYQMDKAKWRADISSNNGRLFLGYYGTEEEAAKAYNAQAALVAGEFANLNQI